MLSRIRIKPTKNEIEESNDIVAVDAPNDMTDIKFSGHNHKLYDLNINMTESQDNDDHCVYINSVD